MRQIRVVTWGVAFATSLALLPGLLLAEQKILNADEVKNLIRGKTVSVTREKDGKEWKIFFAEDGKTYTSDNKEGNWEVNANGEHCNTGVKLKCARIADNGDGTYARLKPNGDTAVTWNKIVTGKDL